MTIIESFLSLFALVRSRTDDVETQRIVQSRRTLSSVVITPDTAVTIPAVWACLRYLSQTVAVLPWRVMRAVGNGSEIQASHPIDYLLHKRASDEWSSFQFRETLLHWALRYGNGYAEIERDTAGRPANLHPIHPSRVEVCRGRDTGALFYEIDGKMPFQPADIFHLRGFGEGPVGISVVTYAAESLGWARAAGLFGSSFFGNAMNASGVLKIKTQKSPEALKRLRRDMDDLYGGVKKANKVVFVDGEDEFQPLSVSPENAQFIETNQHLVEEVCRWFGVPPHKVMHLLRATFSNIEHQAIEVVVDSISPWVKRFEDEADWKLFGRNRPNFFTKMNMNALLRGDVAARAAWYKTMREIGALSINDILRLEDVNGIGPEGDKRVMQSQFTTLERIGEEPVAEPPPSPSNGNPEQESTDDASEPRAA